MRCEPQLHWQVGRLSFQVPHSMACPHSPECPESLLATLVAHWLRDVFRVLVHTLKAEWLSRQRVSIAVLFPGRYLMLKLKSASSPIHLNPVRWWSSHLIGVLEGRELFSFRIVFLLLTGLLWVGLADKSWYKQAAR